jgi:hypothetical protein
MNIYIKWSSISFPFIFFFIIFKEKKKKNESSFSFSLGTDCTRYDTPNTDQKNLLFTLLKPAQKATEEKSFFFFFSVVVVVDPGRITLPEWLRHTARNTKTQIRLCTVQRASQEDTHETRETPKKRGGKMRNPQNTHQGHEHKAHTHTPTEKYNANEYISRDKK